MKNLSSQNVVRCEEKEDRILDFLGYYFELLSSENANNFGEKSVTLIARSPSSPVARALYAFVSEASAGDISIQIIFSQLEPTDVLSDWLELMLDETSTAPKPDIRWAKTPTLIDAHEQLVLGKSMSWSGDSMRREPSKRDAFELFRSSCTQSAEYGLRAFNMIWGASETIPVRLSNSLVKTNRSEAKAVQKQAEQGGETPLAGRASQATSGTRH